jgi:hypothetical protein
MSRKVHMCLRIVEYTSIPLSLVMSLYVLSGYGMVSPIPSLIGFTYPTSVKIHTLPLLRYVTSLLIALHGYAGIVVLANRYLWRYKVVKDLVEVLGTIYALLIIMIATLSEVRLYP